jgi:hypothetical protein
MTRSPTAKLLLGGDHGAGRRQVRIRDLRVCERDTRRVLRCAFWGVWSSVPVGFPGPGAPSAQQAMGMAAGRARR